MRRIFRRAMARGDPRFFRRKKTGGDRALPQRCARKMSTRNPCSRKGYQKPAPEGNTILLIFLSPGSEVEFVIGKRYNAHLRPWLSAPEIPRNLGSPHRRLTLFGGFREYLRGWMPRRFSGNANGIYSAVRPVDGDQGEERIVISQCRPSGARVYHDFAFTKKQRVHFPVFLEMTTRRNFPPSLSLNPIKSAKNS